MSKPEPFEALPQYLESKLLLVGKDWQVLRMGGADWPALKSTTEADAQTDENLLSLVLAYIRVNGDRVERLQQVSNLSSDVLLGAPQLHSDGILSNLDRIDRQSLLVFRLQAGLHLDKFPELVDYLRGPENSSWVKKSFLYPFIYYSLNNPADAFMDTFLSYMVPSDTAAYVERDVIKHLLREDLSFTKSFAFRAYLALACHPYDAFDSLVSYYEMVNVAGPGLLPSQAAILAQLASWFPDSRASRLDDYINRPGAHQGSDRTERVVLSDRVPQSVKKLVSDFVEIDSQPPGLDDLPNDQLKALARMRWSRYPDESDFEAVTGTARAWGFLEGGRIYSALCTSMYMLNRDSAAAETRHLYRLHALAGRSTPFIWAAPRGHELLMRQAHAGGVSWLGTDLRAGAALAKRLKAPDRSWFSAVHWELQKHERSVHVRRWLSVVRAHFPVKPRYLSGIDWSWIGQVLPICRIAPFRESTNGPYALLLREIEEFTRDDTLLRTAIERRALGRTCDDFVGLLISEYGESATAFVRYFLTAENILMLGLAPNMTAALSERISALERCAAALGFSELLSEDQLRSEQETLTAALMLLNVNANQFDIPWSAFRRDAGERQRDNYSAFLAFQKASRTLERANEQVIPYPHVFANGKAVEYTFDASRFNLGLFSVGVIDAFHEHPSYGLEAILSTRFRHDTLRRELKSVLDTLEGLYIAGVAREDQKVIVQALSVVALDAVDVWLSRFMQTKRPGVPDALFDLVPDQAALSILLNDIYIIQEMDRSLIIIQEWIEKRLDTQLAFARQSFSSQCLDDALRAARAEARVIQQDQSLDFGVTTKVLSAVTSTLTRRFDELSEWFKMPKGSQQPPLALSQIKAAVDGRYEYAVSTGKLAVELEESPAFAVAVPEDAVKLIFDLLSEVYNNCVKYSGLSSTLMTIRPGGATGDGAWGCLISSAAAFTDETWSRKVPGHPYMSISDAIMREGNSGLDKISSLSSTLTQRAGEITASRLESAFELEIPLGRHT